MAIFSGDIFAENYTVSSSVTNVQISSVSGSTKSGDSTDDTHQFTGSISLKSSQGDLRIGYTPGGSPSGIRFYNYSNNYHFYTTSDRIFTAKTAPSP